MTAITLMAALLDAELQARGIFSIGRKDCEAIITSVIGRVAAVTGESLAAMDGVRIEDGEPPEVST